MTAQGQSTPGAADETGGPAPVRAVVDEYGLNAYAIRGFAEARQALAEARLSKDQVRFFAGDTSRNLHPAVKQSMLASDPPTHTRLRQHVARAFAQATTPVRVRQWIDQAASALVDALPESGTADLVPDLAVPLPIMVISDLLDVPEGDRAALRTISNDLFAAGQPATRDTASHALAEYMTTLVAERRRHTGDDLLSCLVAAIADDRLSESEVVSAAVLLIVAGHETTTNLIGNTMLALLSNPRQYELVRTNPSLAADAVEEALRYDSPLYMATFRFAAEDLHIGAERITAGCPVHVLIHAANRDPRRHVAPHVYDIQRQDKEHLSFGAGIHYCLGSSLARLEAEAVVRHITGRRLRLELAEGAAAPLRRKTRLINGLERLPVVIHPA